MQSTVADFACTRHASISSSRHTHAAKQLHTAKAVLAVSFVAKGVAAAVGTVGTSLWTDQERCGVVFGVLCWVVHGWGAALLVRILARLAPIH